MEFAFVIVAGGAASLLVSYFNRTIASPVLAIVNRWLRWISYSLLVAWLMDFLALTGRPFTVLAVTAFLLIFLIETLYNWLAISALSQSPIPLFPKFSINASGEEWPAVARIIAVRDWLRKNKFTQVQALLADIGNGIHLRVSVYQDAEAKIRVQVLFIPMNSSSVTVCFAVTSETEAGMRYTTDNLFLPFGGFYPENWSVERRPWTRRLPALIKAHRARIKNDGMTLAPLHNDPLSDLNDQQRDLDRLNTELGFLFPHGMREEYGKMTFEGRYRVWKEVWFLNYLGLPQRY
ncbi:MAG: hypothetical protein IAE82_16200 [Opitutaceae bacterium]|nr:hypothetical protein [Opitutaceae bacterium]